MNDLWEKAYYYAYVNSTKFNGCNGKIIHKYSPASIVWRVGTTQLHSAKTNIRIVAFYWNIYVYKPIISGEWKNNMIYVLNIESCLTHKHIHLLCPENKNNVDKYR